MITRNQTLALTCLWLVCANAHAATVSLEPATASAAPGSTVSLSLVVSGLGDLVASSLADFDIDIGFDASALTFAGYSLGTALGDTGTGEALDVSFGLFSPGVVNIAQVSFLTPGELDALQGDTVVVATLDFVLSGLAAGATTSVDVAGVFALGDTAGGGIPLDGTAGALVTAIPLPAAVWLLGGALLFLRPFAGRAADG